MKLKKILPIALSLTIALSMSACNKNDEKKIKDKNNQSIEISNNDESYIKTFNEIYKDKIESMKDYDMYSSLDKTIEYYKSNEYPGNQQYLNNMKEMYKNVQNNITEFVKELKNINVIDNEGLINIKTSLIAEAELTISNINEKLERINQIPESVLEKPKDEFLKLVDETAKIKDGIASTFSSMVEHTSKKFNSK